MGQQQANVYQNTTNSLMDLYKPQQQQQSGLGSAIEGGLNLGGALLGPTTGGLSGLAGDITGKMLKGSGFLGGKYFSA